MNENEIKKALEKIIQKPNSLEMELGTSRKLDDDDIARLNICMLLGENESLRQQVEEQRKELAQQKIAVNRRAFENYLIAKYGIDSSKGRITVDAEGKTLNYVDANN